MAIFVASERRGERILASLTEWIAKHLKLRVNAAKSGTGRPWNGRFLGFRITNDGRIAPAKSRLERLKDKVREVWNARWSVPLDDRIRHWRKYIRGWWNDFRLGEVRWRITALESWMRRHMRKYFWHRWPNRQGRLNALKRLRAKPYHLKQASGSVGAWRQARSYKPSSTRPGSAAGACTFHPISRLEPLGPTAGCGPIRQERIGTAAGWPRRGEPQGGGE